jgi:pumilio family protein 6
MDVIRGKVKDIVLKHDASRIVQTVVKYGRQKERDEIATELGGCYKDLARNKYSKVGQYHQHYNLLMFMIISP